MYKLNECFEPPQQSPGQSTNQDQEQEEKDKVVQTEQEQPQPELRRRSEHNEDTTTYWDIQ